MAIIFFYDIKLFVSSMDKENLGIVQSSENAWLQQEWVRDTENTQLAVV